MGRVKTPLDSRLRLNPNVLLTLRMMFAEPFASALIYQLFAVRYKPRFVLFPDGFQSLGFSPYFGRQFVTVNHHAVIYSILFNAPLPTDVRVAVCSRAFCLNRTKGVIYLTQDEYSTTKNSHC